MLLFQNGYPALRAATRSVFARLPEASGLPISIQFREDLSGLGPIHAGALLRERKILLERSLARDRVELARIFVHELFHFVWLRLGNPRRRAYERLIAAEISAGAGGELGWSAEWRKIALDARDRRERTRRWREYCCESFCDSAAWMFAGIGKHAEFTLERRFRSGRRRWFREAGLAARISV